jgi:hypothetical protein
MCDGSRRKTCPSQLIRQVVIRDGIDMTRAVSRIVRRQKQRVEQHGKTRVKIPPAGIRVENIWSADDRDSARPQDTKKLARERKLIFEVFNNL